MVTTHRKFMLAALSEARLAARRGEVPVGAVVVRDGKVLARGKNEIVARKDPTAHAEVLAIRKAAVRLRNERLVGCTLYTTLEPCPMCAGAAVLARIAEVVYGARDPRGGAGGSIANILSHPRLNHRCRVTGPLMAGRSGSLLRGFFRKRR